MRVLILGGGLAGCTMAYLCRSVGFDVHIVEANEQLGGLCRTETSGGHSFEFGPHILYAASPLLKQFFEMFVESMPIKYHPRVSIDGHLREESLFDFPVTLSSLLRLPDARKLVEELYGLNLENPSFDNFEDYVISRMGRTAYSLFVENYNAKQWGVHPRDMTAAWAKHRPGLRVSAEDKGLFGDVWQGHPGSYNEMFRSLSEGSIISANCRITSVQMSKDKTEVMGANGLDSFDFYISTIPLDRVIPEKIELPYRGIHKVFFVVNTPNALPTYAVSFPNNHSFTRVLDYKKHCSLPEKWDEDDTSLISFAFPFNGVRDSAETLPINRWVEEAEGFIKKEMKVGIVDVFERTNRHVYPVATPESEAGTDMLLEAAAKIRNFVTVGRLGLYSYISMDTCVNQCFEIFKLILNEKFFDMGPDERLNEYRRIRERQS